MPRIISREEKRSVIDDWLGGESRNKIAIKHDLGSSTVYNYILEWSNEFGVQRADRLRALAIKLKKNRLTVTDCAKGLRMLMIFKKYGIDNEEEDQDRIAYFLKEIYNKCQEVELKPQQVFDYISDILKFSSEIFISQIPQFMKKRTEEKEELENAIQKYYNKINELSNSKKEIEEEIERLLKIKETTTKTYKTYTILKYQLKKYGIGMENLSQFVKCVVGISKKNYDPVQILSIIADYENLEKNANYYKEQVNLKKDELAKLKQDIHLRQIIDNLFKIKVDNVNELEAKGFGINQLRTLSDMLNEISEENNYSFDGIRKEFFDDVKNNYSDVIGSRKEIERLRNELKILEVQTMKEREKYTTLPKILESLIRLSAAGIYEDDIVKIDKILSKTDYYYLYKDKPMSKEALFDDLQKYGNLKLAIKNLEDIEISLKKPNKGMRNRQIKKKSARLKKTTEKNPLIK
jgi:hypothetical protein